MTRRRTMIKGAIAAAAFGACGVRTSPSAAAELRVPDAAASERWDFEVKGIDGWNVVDGQWAVEPTSGAPSGKRVLVQRATRNAFNVIVAPSGPFTDVDISVKFKPMTGREDASGGIVFRFSDAKYYVIRANALEDNFRFYYYDRGRHMLETARITAPALGQWHTLRVAAVGDQVQGWINGILLLDARDKRFTIGRVGLWTKSDSVTAFDDLTIRGVAVPR